MPKLMNLPAMLLTAGATPVSVESFQSVIDALTAQISVSTIVGVLAAVVGLCIGFVFMHWGVRKAKGAILSAAFKGRLR